MLRRGTWIAVVLTTGCGSNSLVIGGDPEASALSSENGTGLGGGGSASGSGGTGGIAPSFDGSAGAPNDRYPWVIWAQGNGHEYSCPPAGNQEGFLCWSHGAESSQACDSDGDPYCNACLCRISCETGSDCPSGRNGETPECLGESELDRSCFLACDGAFACPSGMTCSAHPALDRRVCIWVDGDDTWQGTPK
jgi:hypothetical protein